MAIFLPERAAPMVRHAIASDRSRVGARAKGAGGGERLIAAPRFIRFRSVIQWCSHLMTRRSAEAPTPILLRPVRASFPAVTLRPGSCDCRTGPTWCSFRNRRFIAAGRSPAPAGAGSRKAEAQFRGTRIAVRSRQSRVKRRGTGCVGSRYIPTARAITITLDFFA